MKLDTPILLLIFNRVDTTKEVFSKIREAKPLKLYIACDGPRNDKVGEYDRVINLRKDVLSWVDWDCEINTLFREKNLGCKEAVSSAISWFFDNEEQGIILEDDCVPSPSFFSFCNKMLDRYKNDLRVWEISGYRYKMSSYPSENHKSDYFFSQFSSIWGWATWKNRWQFYEKNVASYKNIPKKIKGELVWVNSHSASNEIKKNMQAIIDGLNTWDYQWRWTIIYNRGLVIKPKFNLVKNIGFSHEEATHTQSIDDRYLQDYQNMPNNLVHPKYIRPDYLFDFFYSQEYMKVNSIYERLIIKLKKFFIKENS